MKISQREARQLRKRVADLERILDYQKSHWVKDWPGGVHIATMDGVPERVIGAVATARRLRHAVIVTETGGQFHFYGMSL